MQKFHFYKIFIKFIYQLNAAISKNVDQIVIENCDRPFVIKVLEEMQLSGLIVGFYAIESGRVANNRAIIVIFKKEFNSKKNIIKHVTFLYKNYKAKNISLSAKAMAVSKKFYIYLIPGQAQVIVSTVFRKPKAGGVPLMVFDV